MANNFNILFEDLSTELAVFPLSGVLLLPSGRLPLNIFEPRYLNMVFDSIKAQRLIGMVQTFEDESGPGNDQVQIYKTGCVGKIVSFAETKDGCIHLTLEGVCRFDTVAELENRNGYRCVRADYNRYRGDVLDLPQSIDRDVFERHLRDYFQVKNIQVDWDVINNADDKLLFSNLAMLCPFSNQEKQALLEADDFGHMIDIMTSLMKMAIQGGDESYSKH
ncbi:MAG: LON peptidase substrate-binding domain-containing protein [Pseudomonadota bacterium]|nr:LON peptidase substrate-binding domain-containing protein [Pseudomonadota bacterium]